MGTAATECAWCGNTFGEGAGSLAGRTRCSLCGAATTDPLPTAEELDAAYGDWYRPDGERRFSFAGDAILRFTRGRLAGRIDQISPAGPVLDVGAGDGTLIDELQARGREATGLERGSGRADFRDEPLSAIDGQWAAVIFWHSLEHLPDPGDAIREAARLLGSGGIIAVAVPNNDSIQARAFGDRWLHLDLPRHLVHLSADSLEDGLRQAGFEIERVSFARAGQIVIGWLHGLVGKLPGQPNLYQALRRRQARIAPQSAGKRAYALVAAVALLPFAALAGIAEIIMRRAGTVYIEARHV
ncbi:MAG: class I SAM-dependent methyltransferase [Thermoleophilia bacterium]|nr:class I SAM-dependent methyltransferase [Thermoleophilia bacterium]